MEYKNYNDGYLDYTSEIIKDIGEDIKLNEWENGYLAFSKGEIRLSDYNTLNCEDVFKSKVSLPDIVDGYLMEANVWRNRGGLVEELVIEREDNGFLIQRWTLYTKKTDKNDTNCFYEFIKPHQRKTIGNTISLFTDEELASIEVVYPEYRLHFFITTGRINNE